MSLSEPEIAAHVKAMLVTWAEGSDLRERIESDFATAFAWAVTCSPKDAPLDRLALATMDLHLWFLYLDDYSKPDYADFFQCLSKMIGGDRSVLDSGDDETRRALRQFDAHIERLAKLGPSLSRYIEEREVALAVYEQRNDKRKSGWAPGFAELLKLREVTTLFRLWYTLWEVLGGFQISDEEYGSVGFDRAIMATTRWHVLVNDIHSLARDAEAGMPNLVLCLERDLGMSRAQAVAELLRQCAGLERELETAWRDTVDLERGVGNLGTAFAFLQLNIEGGRDLYRRSLARYQAQG